MLAEPLEWQDADEVAPAAPPVAGRVRIRVMLVLLLVLPLFGQSFHYLKDVMPLWALSKAFPILTLPFAFWLLRYPHLPLSRQILVSFCWLVIVPSLAGIFYFQQNFFLGLSAQVKLLPILYFYSFLVLLFLLRPSSHELARAFFLYGLATYGLVIALSLLVPNSWYNGHYVVGTAPMFSDDDRGHRIRMPMFFGIVFLLYCFRRFLRATQLRWLLGAVVGFVIVLTIVKTRSMIIGIIAMLLLNGFLAAGPWLRILILMLGPVGLAGLFSINYLGSLFGSTGANGLDIRVETIKGATDFLGDDPLRWLLGVGTISPASSDSLQSYFNHFFFLGDITWIGIIFEFGLVGAALILLLQLRGLAFYHRNLARLDSDFLLSLRDYVLFEVVISNLYPLTLSPGESMMICAIFVYVWRTEVWRTEVSHAGRPALEHPEAG